MSSHPNVVQAETTKEIHHEILLKEYEKAQDSAQHHDNLVWSITSVNWVGSGVLMSAVLQGLSRPSTFFNKTALIGLSTVGILLAVLVWRWTYQMRRVKVSKYLRCKEIETTLGMKQHSDLKYQHASQTRGYGLLMSLFITVWFLIVAMILRA